MEFYENHSYNNGNSISFPINLLQAPLSWVKVREVNDQHANQLCKAILEDPSKKAVAEPLLVAIHGKFFFNFFYFKN